MHEAPKWIPRGGYSVLLIEAGKPSVLGRQKPCLNLLGACRLDESMNPSEVGPRSSRNQEAVERFGDDLGGEAGDREEDGWSRRLDRLVRLKGATSCGGPLCLGRGHVLHDLLPSTGPAQVLITDVRPENSGPPARCGARLVPVAMNLSQGAGGVKTIEGTG